MYDKQGEVKEEFVGSGSSYQYVDLGNPTQVRHGAFNSLSHLPGPNHFKPYFNLSFVIYIDK